MILFVFCCKKYHKSIIEGKRLRVYTLHNSKKAVTAFV